MMEDINVINADEKIEYMNMPLENLKVEENHFDIVLSLLGFH